MVALDIISGVEKTVGMLMYVTVVIMYNKLYLYTSLLHREYMGKDFPGGLRKVYSKFHLEGAVKTFCVKNKISSKLVMLTFEMHLTLFTLFGVGSTVSLRT